MTTKRNEIRPKHCHKNINTKSQGGGGGKPSWQRVGGGNREASFSGTETFSRMKGDLSHKSTYKRKPENHND